MGLDPWLPAGWVFPDGTNAHTPIYGGTHWQIVETQCSQRVLVVENELAKRWVDSELVELGSFSSFDFGGRQLWVISSGFEQVLCPVEEGSSPDTKEEALAFALSLAATREIDSDSPLQDALYVEKISRLLPTYSISSRTEDDVVLGYWLSGGARVSAKSFRRLHQTMTWLSAGELRRVVQAAGIEVAETILEDKAKCVQPQSESLPTEHVDGVEPQLDTVQAGTDFELAGRPDLAGFFNEHIVDIIQNRERYMALGINFPSAVLLHGPPGCGKTFAVDRLIDFLGWPSFQIDSSNVASPYIHETSKKVAEVFDTAMQNSPSVLVIDEMEAFLADREMGSGHHRVEEVAEFLRRIPEATKNDVLIVAMTNRVDMIDPAILRRGRFDHVVIVDFASEIEVLSLLKNLLEKLPKDPDVDPQFFARELAGRPLSDVAFIVREGARLAARSGKAKLNQESLLAAMHASPARAREGAKQARIGFI